MKNYPICLSIIKKALVALAVLLIPGFAAAADRTPAARQAPAAHTERYALALFPTPVLNTPAFARVFSGELRLDPCKGVRPIEFVALPGTLFTVVGEQEEEGVPVYRVTSNDYPYPSTTGYFVDARFVKMVSPPVQERARTLPGLSEVQRRLLAALGSPYVWGGNLREGVPQLRQYYPRADLLAGVDCSGLLYQATDGFTPRNTSALTRFGKGVPVAGLSPEAIAKKLRPLDLVVWKGHVMVVLDGDSFIQSTMGCNGGEAGVHLTPLRGGLSRLMKSRMPVDEYPQGAAGAKAFVVRRWFSN